MTNSHSDGVVRTVLGDIDAGTVGQVMFHEHLLFDIVPPHATGDRLASITLEDRWQIDYLSNQAPANACQTDSDIAVYELCHFKADGGSLIVDQSVHGLARNAEGLAHAARTSGIHVVASGGTYTAPYVSPNLLDHDIDALTKRFVAEINQGLDGTSICAGLIGEIGCSWPLHPFEHRALRAAARAADATGACLSVHPGRASGACAEVLDITEAEGLDPGRTVLCHMDRTHPTGEGIAPLLARGACVEWDFFGIEQSHYWMGDVELPNDRDRLRLIDQFAQAGHAAQILISHDICTKTRMRHWGGHGYGHILRNMPALMQQMGFDPILLRQLLRNNPLRLLTLQETLT